MIDPTVRADLRVALFLFWQGAGINVSTMEFIRDVDDLNLKEDMFTAVAMVRSVETTQGLRVAVKQTDPVDLPLEVVLLNLVVPGQGSCTLAIF